MEPFMDDSSLKKELPKVMENIRLICDEYFWGDHTDYARELCYNCETHNNLTEFFMQGFHKALYSLTKNLQAQFSLLPLHIAARKGDIEMVTYIVANVDKTIKLNYMLDTPLFLAMLHKNYKIADMLLPLAAFQHDGRKHKYSMLNHYGLTLADRWLATRIYGEEIDTPIPDAFVTDYKNLRLFLLHYITEGTKGSTFDHMEDQYGLPAIKAIMDFIGHIRPIDDSGLTPIHVVVWCCEYKVLALLLNYTDVPNYPDHKGITPMHYAARRGMKEGVEILMKYGKCDPNPPDTQGITPGQIAMKYGHSDLTKLFVKHVDRLEDVTLAFLNEDQKKALDDENRYDLTIKIGKFEQKWEHRCDGHNCFKKQWCPIPYEKRHYLSFPPPQKALDFKFAVPQDFFSKVKTASEITEFHEQQKYKFWQKLMQDGPQFILTEDLLDV